MTQSDAGINFEELDRGTRAIKAEFTKWSGSSLPTDWAEAMARACLMAAKLVEDCRDPLGRSVWDATRRNLGHKDMDEA